MSAHSAYSFSGSHRWLQGRCPASVNRQRGLHNPTNDAAEIGTAAHELAEFCLKLGIQPDECLGLIFNKRVVDWDMINAVSVYVGHVRANRSNYMLERKVNLMLDGRDDIYGTSDLLAFDNRTLYVDDYKHGYGLVEVANNTQTICYAVAALDTYNAWFKVDRVVCTIIQPRGDHVDGVVRSHTYSIDELLQWRSIIVNSIRLADDPTTKAVAGEWCKYCLAAPTCKPRLIRTIDLAFDDEQVVSDETLIKLYPEIKLISSHLNNIADRIDYMAATGAITVPGHKLVRQRKYAKCSDETLLIKDVEGAGLDVDELYEKKLKSKTKLKPIIGASLTNKHFKVEDAGLTLAPMSDSRPAVSLNKSAVNIFKEVK